MRLLIIVMRIAMLIIIKWGSFVTSYGLWMQHEHGRICRCQIRRNTLFSFPSNYRTSLLGKENEDENDPHTSVSSPQTKEETDRAEVSSLTTTSTNATMDPSIEDIITYTCSLLSYQCAEESLKDVLAALVSAQIKTRWNIKIKSNVRGRLEHYIVEDNFHPYYVEKKQQQERQQQQQVDDSSNIVDLFLSVLAFTTVGSYKLNDGVSICRFFYHHSTYPLPRKNHNNNNTIPSSSPFLLPFKPPTRSLIGDVDGYDVSLLRDKLDVQGTFIMLLSNDRAKGKKIARLLAEINETTGIVSIRGIHVHESYRSKGISTLLIAFFSHVFCPLVFGGEMPRTKFMNKPLVCVALTSLGFVPDNAKYPVWVTPNDNDKDGIKMTLVKEEDMSIQEEENIDLRPLFPRAVRKAQKITLVAELPKNCKAKRTYVLTEFSPPSKKKSAGQSCSTSPMERRLQNSTYHLYSARIIAFLATMEKVQKPLFHSRCRGLHGEVRQ